MTWVPVPLLSTSCDSDADSNVCGFLLSTSSSSPVLAGCPTIQSHSLYIKYITNKDLQYSTGNSTHYIVITYKEKESEQNRYVCSYN